MLIRGYANCIIAIRMLESVKPNKKAFRFKTRKAFWFFGVPLVKSGGVDGARTRDILRDRQVL